MPSVLINGLSLICSIFQWRNVDVWQWPSVPFVPYLCYSLPQTWVGSLSVFPVVHMCPWYVNTLMSSLNKNDISLTWSLSLEVRIECLFPTASRVHGCALLFPPLGRQQHTLLMFLSVQAIAWPFCCQFLFNNADRIRNRFFLVKINHYFYQIITYSHTTTSW